MTDSASFRLLSLSGIVLVWLIGSALALASEAQPDALKKTKSHSDRFHSFEILSKMHTVDRVYPSMKGPSDTQFFKLEDVTKPELLWLKSVKVDILDKQGESQSSEYLCHSNLYFSDYQRHHKIFGRSITPNQRFIDINQGLLTVLLPDGFGIPIMSGEQLKFHSMVMNLQEKPEPFDLQLKTTFEYVRNSERVGPMKALAQRAIPMWIPVAAVDAHAHHHASPEESSEGSMDEGMTNEKYQADGEDGLSAPANPTPRGYRTRPDGVSETRHWMVPPGRHSFSYRPDKGLKMPFPKASIHVLTGHMHAYGESIELRDLTTGESLFVNRAKGFDDAIGIEFMTHYSSQDGFLVHRDHKYEILATYNNTSSSDIDAMAVIYLYYLDERFDEQAIGSLKIGQATN